MGDNALHVAASCGCADVASLLIVAGASKSARNRYGERPIDIATRLGDLDIASLLMSRSGHHETEL